MTQAVTTTLSTSHVVMEAGQERESEILVRNQGEEMDQFTVQVLGPAAAWTSVVPSVVTVAAGEEEWVRVVYAPPRSAEARQGKSHVAFRVTSYNDPTTSTLEEAVVEVAAFAELEVRLDPPQRTTTRRGRFLLTAVNRGNSPVRCQANAYGLDEGEGLDILVAGPEFVSEPGSTTQLPVRVQAKRRFMRGQDQSLPFAVEVNGDILERPAMVEGVLNQEPVLNAARLKLLVAALALLALLLGGWFTWYSLTADDQPLGGATNGQASGAAGAGGTQAPVVGESGVAGASGSAGLPGLPGAAGNQGLAGTAGTAGLAGAAGTKGDAGAVGAAGAAGNAGAAGKDGQAGAQGAAGLVGDTGQAGAAGAAGVNGTVVMGQVSQYSDLAGLVTTDHLGPSDAGKAWLNQADGLLYIWNGSGFPQNGQGIQYRGQAGSNGSNGSNGTSVSIQGEAPTYAQLPSPSTLTPADAGKGWIVTYDGELYIWSGTAFPPSGQGLPYRSVAAPTSIDIGTATVQPQNQTLNLVHYVRSGTAALYYIRADVLTAVDDVSLVDQFGGTSTLTLTEPGPGTGDVVDATHPWSNELTIDPAHPLLVELKCTPTDPTDVNAGCGAGITLGYRAAVPTTIMLPTPTDTITASTPIPVVFHQIPGSPETSTTYTVTAPGDDTEVTGISASPGFGGTASVAVGPAGNSRQPVVTSTTPAVFGSTAVPATPETLVVTKNNPVTLTVSCTFTSPATTCGTDLVFSVRRPVARTLALPAPPGTADKPFQLQRSMLSGSAARYVLTAPAGQDLAVQSVSLVDTVGQGHTSVTFAPGTSGATTITGTAATAPQSTAVNIPVTSTTPLAVEFSCAAADATSGCAAELSVTVGPPTPTTLPALTPAVGTSSETFPYDRTTPGHLGRYLVTWPADTVVTGLSVGTSTGVATIRVTTGGGSQAVLPPAPWTNQLVTAAVPMLVEVTCVDPVTGCDPTLVFTTAAPGATQNTLSATGSQQVTMTYDVGRNSNGLNAFSPAPLPAGTPANRNPGTVLSAVSFTSDDPGAVLSIGPAAPGGSPVTVTPSQPWSGSLIAGVGNPLSIDLTCSAPAKGCQATTTVTSSPVAQPLPLTLTTAGMGTNGASWSFSNLSYDPLHNVPGNYAIAPDTGTQEITSLAPTSPDAQLVIPGTDTTSDVMTTASSPPISIFTNPAHPITVLVRCVDGAATCSTGLKVTAGPAVQGKQFTDGQVFSTSVAGPTRFLLTAASARSLGYAWISTYQGLPVSMSVRTPALGDSPPGPVTTVYPAPNGQAFQTPISPALGIGPNDPVVVNVQAPAQIPAQLQFQAN